MQNVSVSVCLCVCVDRYVFDLCLICAQFAGLYIKYTDSVLTTEIGLFKCTQRSTDHKRGRGGGGSFLFI